MKTAVAAGDSNRRARLEWVREVISRPLEKLPALIRRVK